LTTIEFFKRAVIVVLVALVPVLGWFLFDVILIVIGAVLVLLRLVAEPFTRWARFRKSLHLSVRAFSPSRLSLAPVICLLHRSMPNSPT
jgi:hypothetical protein